MTVRERILMIRLMEKLEKNPSYAKALGVEAASAGNNQKNESNLKGLTNV